MEKGKGACGYSETGKSGHYPRKVAKEKDERLKGR